MEIPKYIERIICLRAKLAARLTEVDYALTKWFEKNGVVEHLEDYDYRSGVEMYVNPYNSAMRIREAIRKTRK